MPIFPVKTVPFYVPDRGRKLCFHLGCLAILLYGFYLASCAAVQAPSGGPLDTTPPRLVLAEPPSGTVQFQGGSIHLVFSEYMDEERLARGIRVFPQLSTPPEIKFHGKELDLSLPDDLISNQTYIVSLGREVADEHGVEMEAPVHLAYSTGEVIDSSRIGGHVYGSDQVSLHLWTLQDSLTLDSLFQMPPDYITDATDEGTYLFDFLAPGTYQVLALERQATGMPLDPIRMQHGIYWNPFISLPERETVKGVNMRLRREPEPWRLLRGNWFPQGYGQLIFNRLLPADGLSSEIVIQTPDSLLLETMTFIDPLDRHNLIVVTHDSLPPEKVIVSVTAVRRGDTTYVDSASVSLRVPEEQDTTALVLSQPTQKITLKPEGEEAQELELVFTKPVIISNPDDNIQLYVNDTIRVALAVRIVNPMMVKVHPTTGWQLKTGYQLLLLSKGFEAWNGTRFQDSLYTIQVNTTEPPGYGGILGSLQGSSSPGLMVEVTGVEKAFKRARTVVNSQAKFVFKTLPEGRYTLMVFEDRDGNGAYTFGTAFPFRPSEWFFIYPDTIEVRANWDVELGPINWREDPLGKTYD